MADPVSIIGLVIDLAPRVIGYISDVVDSSSDQQKLVSELAGATGLLFALQSLIKSGDCALNLRASAQALTGNNGPLFQFESLLKSMEKELQPTSRAKRLGRPFVWHWRKKSLDPILQAIERYKLVFTVALQADEL